MCVWDCCAVTPQRPAVQGSWRVLLNALVVGGWAARDC